MGKINWKYAWIAFGVIMVLYLIIIDHKHLPDDPEGKYPR